MPSDESRSRGARLRKARENKGLARDGAASAVGITGAYLSLLERGHSAPGRDLLFRLARIYDLTPEYIETGRESPSQLLQKLVFSVWPEVVYMLANHAAVVASIDGHELKFDDPALSAVVVRARASCHLCEFLSWANAAESQNALDAPHHSAMIESLVRQFGTQGAQSHLWAEWAERRELCNGLAREYEVAYGDRGRGRQRFSIAGGHSAPSHSPTDRKCFECEMANCFHMLQELMGGRAAVQAPVDAMPSTGPFGATMLRRSFVQKAFPTVFWHLSRCWAPRRMLAWLDFIGMPRGLSQPMIAIAGGQQTFDSFVEGGSLLFNRVPDDPAELFMSSIPALYFRSRALQKRVGVRPFAMAIGSISANCEQPSIVERHRQLKRQLRAQLALNLIFQRESEDKQRAVESYLERMAPAHMMIDDARLIERNYNGDETPASETRPTGSAVPGASGDGHNITDVAVTPVEHGRGRRRERNKSKPAARAALDKAKPTAPKLQPKPTAGRHK